MSYRCFSPTNSIQIPIIIHLEGGEKRGGGVGECVAHAILTTNSKELIMYNVANNHYVDMHLNYCIQTDEEEEGTKEW